MKPVVFMYVPINAHMCAFVCKFLLAGIRSSTEEGSLWTRH